MPASQRPAGPGAAPSAAEWKQLAGLHLGGAVASTRSHPRSGLQPGAAAAVRALGTQRA